MLLADVSQQDTDTIAAPSEDITVAAEEQSALHSLYMAQAQAYYNPAFLLNPQPYVGGDYPGNRGKAPQSPFLSDNVVEDVPWDEPHFLGASLPVSDRRVLCDAAVEGVTKSDMENQQE